MAETAQAFSWIDATMRADSALMAAATGGVFQGLADIGTQPPFVTYNWQSGADVLTLNANRLYASILMQVKAIGPGSMFTSLVTIAGRIDALFKSVRATGLPGGGGVLSCYRESEISMNELINGSMWAHLGGLYRISLQGV